jgi:hypothetical protein
LLLTTAFLTAFQTSLWFHFFGNLAGPMLWLIVLVYVNLYKKPLESILLSYFLCLQIYFFGWIPIGFLFTLILIIFTLTWIIKERIFWSGHGYFIYATIATSVAYQLLYLFCSWTLELVPVHEINFLDRVFQCLITPIFALPIYYFLKLIERLTDQTPLIETGEYQL